MDLTSHSLDALTNRPCQTSHTESLSFLILQLYLLLCFLLGFQSVVIKHLELAASGNFSEMTSPPPNLLSKNLQGEGKVEGKGERGRQRDREIETHKERQRQRAVCVFSHAPLTQGFFSTYTEKRSLDSMTQCSYQGQKTRRGTSIMPSYLNFI